MFPDDRSLSADPHLRRTKIENALLQHHLPTGNFRFNVSHAQSLQSRPFTVLDGLDLLHDLSFEKNGGCEVQLCFQPAVSRSTLCCGSSGDIGSSCNPSPRLLPDTLSGFSDHRGHSVSWPLNVSGLEMSFVSKVAGTKGTVLIIATAASATCRAVSSASCRSASRSCRDRSSSTSCAFLSSVYKAALASSRCGHPWCTSLDVDH